MLIDGMPRSYFSHGFLQLRLQNNRRYTDYFLMFKKEEEEEDPFTITKHSFRLLLLSYLTFESKYSCPQLLTASEITDTESFGAHTCCEFHHLRWLCSIGPLWINDNKAMGNYNKKLVCEITPSWEGKERKLVVFPSKKKAWVSNKYFVRAWEVLFLWFPFIYLKGSKVRGTQVVQPLFLSTDTSVLWTPLLRLHPLGMPLSVC